jgi:uncharacterized membrane protein
LGLSPDDYATYTLALALAIIVVCFVVSTLIIWRRSDDRMALLVALMLVTFGPIFVTATVPESSPLQVPNECLYFLALSLLVLSLLGLSTSLWLGLPLLRRTNEGKRVWPRIIANWVMLFVSLVLYGVQGYYGVRLLLAPHDVCKAFVPTR